MLVLVRNLLFRQSAHLEVQDWFTPWTDFYPHGGGDRDEILLAYARCFYLCALVCEGTMTQHEAIDEMRETWPEENEK